MIGSEQGYFALRINTWRGAVNAVLMAQFHIVKEAGGPSLHVRNPVGMKYRLKVEG